MWYVVDIIFAQKTETDEGKTVCESCCVLFEAPSALAACQKAMPWAENHTTDSDLHLLGIQHVRDLLEKPEDGSEIGGVFFEEVDPWGRRDELIPDLGQTSIIKFEENRNTPIGRLMSEGQIDLFKKVFGEE
jgi:hypothetical protein